MGLEKCDPYIWIGVLLFVVGVLFLLRDLNVLGNWNFWNIQWWSALFVIFGLAMTCKHKIH